MAGPGLPPPRDAWEPPVTAGGGGAASATSADDPVDAVGRIAAPSCDPPCATRASSVDAAGVFGVFGVLGVLGVLGGVAALPGAVGLEPAAGRGGS